MMQKKVIIVFIVVLVIIQFIRPDKNIAKGAQPNAIATKYAVPDNVANILSNACKDCHSNNTKYPWYNNIQPVAWWLNDHIEEAKRKFNFDEFTTYTLKRQDHKLEELIETQKDHWMPMNYYTWLHKEADLTDNQRKVLVDWANVTRLKIQNDPGFAVSAKK